MKSTRTAAALFAALFSAPAFGADPAAAVIPAAPLMPLCGLPPARLVPGLCLVHYRVSTASPECQAFFDQGLGYFYSYVWMEAARSFETAARHDPDCALAWWGLSRSLERWKKGDAMKALQKADELKGRASHREQLLIRARMQEKGKAPGSAVATVDELLALYDDDEEGWYYRAQLAGGAGLFGGELSSVPFYKALVRVNPLHPAANHELLHFYEKFHRPALGWVYAENYIKSSPGIPHPFHMQAHLATRLGRWDRTSDRSTRAVELERAYHQSMGVKPADDQQYGHHLEVLLLSLTHDGRFAEARAAKEAGLAAGHKSWGPWCRLHLAERAWPEALEMVERQRREDKVAGSYLAALVYLEQGRPDRALPEIEVLQQAAGERRGDWQMEYRLWETQGLYLCATGTPDLGLKLLAKAAERSKGDYGHHSWGNGAYLMEAWGKAALRAGRPEVAEEAFLEALAHDPGCVRAALGLEILCEQQGRGEEAGRYADLARRSWGRADPGRLEAERTALRGAGPDGRAASGAG
jgi:tetratricopeptide (TPR) repeat protein